MSQTIDLEPAPNVYQLQAGYPTTMVNYLETVVLVNQNGDTLVNQNGDTLVARVLRSGRADVINLGA